MQGLQIALSFICMTVLLSFSLVLALLFGHRNVLSPIQAISPPPPPPKTPTPLLFLSRTHTRAQPSHYRYWYQDSAPASEGLSLVMNSWAQLGPAGHANSTSLCFFVFFLFRGGGGWGPLVKWIKIPNNSNNNDNKKLIKNGMFLPDCAGVVVFNYAIFIGILIIFSTNKPPLIKAKHG